MATIKEIADKLGIASSTVSKGLNGASDISDELRQQVLSTAAALGYTTKKMKSRDNRRVCIFIENMRYTTQGDFGLDVILGFKQAAFHSNWMVEVKNMTPELQKKERYDTYMLKNEFGGSFLLGFSAQDEWIRQLPDTSVSTVLLDNYIPINPNVCCISTDAEAGIVAAVEHLTKLGHQKIVFLNDTTGSMVSRLRNRTFFDSMHAHGLDVLRTDDYFDVGVTAFICANATIAANIQNQCNRLHLSVPDDISLICFDDSIDGATPDPQLTLIQQHRTNLGKCAHHSMCSLLDQIPVSKMLVHPQLMQRSSTGIVMPRG